MIGQSISHYKITSKLGEGGMGEVYRAIDTKLNRDVALKVLPEAFAADRERMARFSREAQVLASLNHPNIATIHGLEETDGKQALVLELVEGEDLSERIKRGAIPLEESLKIALQMAGALEAAHENGIIHRDLKPANVKITPDGTVKVLDFGLAKAIEPPTGEPDLSKSPTRSLDAAATEMGVVMGTAAYMSPEQARGKPVDKRTDIWAFGVVLYEMLTGKMAFQGEDLSLTLAAVMKENPNWEVLPRTPAPIENLLKRCLDRDQIHRLRDIGEARVAIQDYVADPSAYEADVVAEQPPIPLWRQPTAITAVTLALVIGLSAAWLLKPATPLPEPPLRKLTLEWGEDIHRPVVSPNGRHVAYLRGTIGVTELWIRDLDQEGPRQIVPEGMVSRPFWSADSRFIGFVLDEGLKKVSLQGGPAATLCRVSGPMRGATWSPDSASIVFAAFSPTPGLYEVPAQGGEPKLLFEPGEDRYRDPHFLPSPSGGRKLLYVVGSSVQRHQIVAHDLETGQKELLTSGRDPFFADPGHIVYRSVDLSVVWAVPFSIETLQATGEPFPVRENASHHSVSRDGTLVYLGGGDNVQQLVWRDRTGSNLEAIGQPQQRIRAPALSPDGSRVAVLGLENGNIDVWVHDIVRGLKTRVTSDPAREERPNWLPSGDKISFASGRNGTADIFMKSADGRGELEVLVATPAHEFPLDWTADGNYMIFVQFHAGRWGDLYYLRRDKDGRGYESIVFSETEFDELSPKISPDGRFVAYESKESGSYEVYVQPFPEGPGRPQVSSKGGRQPRWSRDGKEIFYVEGDALMAVPVSTTPTFSAGMPTLLFQGKGAFADRGHSYDVSPDGKKFVIIELMQGGRTPAIQVVENWYEEFREREQD